MEDQCRYAPYFHQLYIQQLTEPRALAGVMAYPLQGLYKTCYTAIHSRTRKEIAAQRLTEGRYLYQSGEDSGKPRSEDVLKVFGLLLTEDDPMASKKATKRAEKERKKQEKAEQNRKVQTQDG